MNNVGNFISPFTGAEKQLSDEVIINFILEGHKHYFEILIRRYNERLFRVARGYLKDEVIIEDIIQETHIRAFEKLSQFEKRARYSTWLTRILINHILAFLKTAEKRSQVDVDLLIAEEDEKFQRMVVEQSEEQKTINRNISGLIEKAIDHLPESHRVVFVMSVVQNISHSETAEILGLTVENVKVRLFRARKMLKSYLKDAISCQDLFRFHLNRCDRITSNVLREVDPIANRYR
ncbi:MAG: sigma-70 family RNA polymerase sigma factor [Cyclobacteriaceae bacterium]